MQEKLLVLRKKKGITQKELASYLGISVRAYSMKERGERQFTLDEMFKLRDFFDMRIEDIFLPRGHQNGDKSA
ncbi:helix-turn-helix transcriptional regulator [Geobacillus kaustophilus]|uniref:Putative helix-turn-helix XRE-family like protein n=1 Tax=Geobacillus stearothermophilus TaxID=1422 RepID=B5DC74_GEOSE|nr:helix-turn-helix transcriptional regulator [Geobacillus kaustophilus]CAQ19387.1 putative helix-turn-helix XRE-family like protein [Geobacillus stearothermophilus]